MRRAFLEVARKIELAQTHDALWEHLTSGIAPFGVENVIYLTIADAPPLEPFVQSSRPENWPQAEFNAPDFVEPFLTHCCATFEITKAGIEFLSDHGGYLDEARTAYIRRFTEFNFRAALGIPCQLIGTGRHGGFIMGNGMTGFEFERSILPLASELQSLCLIADSRIRALLVESEAVAAQPPLSARERETMQLVSTGLRPKKVAHNMGISETSVQLYLKNARAKLGAKTKEEAVAKFMETATNR